MNVSEEPVEDDIHSPDETADELVAGDVHEKAPHINGKVSCRHHEPEGHLGPDESEDVEMG